MDHHMKIPQKVSGRVVYKRPISLSRAAKLISRFAAVENGSSPAVSLYLQRSADAFNHLVQFHDKRSKPKNLDAPAEENPEKVARESEKETVDGGDAAEAPAKKKKKKKKKKRESGEADLDSKSIPTENDSKNLASGRNTDIVNGGDAAAAPKTHSKNSSRENKTETEIATGGDASEKPSKKKKRKKSGESRQ